MPRGDKRKYTDKQKRRAEHIEEGFKERGMSAKEAAARAWATVNAISKGGEKRGGSGYGKPEDHEPMRKGGRKGGATTKAARSRAGKKAAATRKRRGTKAAARTTKRTTKRASTSARTRTTRTATSRKRSSARRGKTRTSTRSRR